MAIPPTASLILPRNLPAASAVTAADMIVGDNGSVVQRVTPTQIVNAATPIPSQAEAEAGIDNDKRMTPLRVAQAINFQAVASATLADDTGATLVGAIGGLTVQAELDNLKQADVDLQDSVDDAQNDATTALNTANAASLAVGGVSDIANSALLAASDALDGVEDLSTDLASPDPGKGAGMVAVQRPEAGAIPQTVFEILTRVVRPTPLSFGGKGDGTTDDTGAVIDCLEKTGRLFLPKGTWLCDSDVIVSALEAVGSVSIQGEGQESILAFAEGGLNLRGRAFRYGTLRDIHLRALGSNQTLLNLIATNSSDWPVRWVIDNIRCSGALAPAANNTGIAIGGGWIGTIINPIIQGLGKGVHIYPTDLASPAVSFNGLNFYGGEIQGNVTGVDMAGTLNVNFFGTAIEGNRGNGVWLRKGSRSVSFYGCYFEANGVDAPTTANDIRIEVPDALDTVFSLLVDSGCSFLNGGVGSQTAIWANKCRELIIEEGAAFNGYTNPLDVQEIAPSTVTGAFRGRSLGSTFPVINNSNYFGDPKSLVAAMGAIEMPDAVKTSGAEIYLELPARAGKLGSIVLNYTADAAGPVRFIVEPFDVATGSALAPIGVTHTAVVGRNTISSGFNFDSRTMRGNTNAVCVSRDGSHAADTNTGTVYLQSVELKWNA